MKNFNLFLILLLIGFGSVKAQKSKYLAADSIGKQWQKKSIKKWLNLYEYQGFYKPFNSNQKVYVLEVDLNNPNAKLIFADQPAGQTDSLSAMVKKYPNAIAAVNGTYYEFEKNTAAKRAPELLLSSSYFKADNKVHAEVTIPTSSELYWKHEGAFLYHPDQQKTSIVYSNANSYKQLEAPNIMSGSPMLIYNYKPVGENFVQPSTINLDSLRYEDPDRHQGVLHPRTAVAKTENNRVLLIAVDGRAEESAGMSAKELTQFIQKWFNPVEALNIDGGGSTTVWIKGSDRSSTQVINYPTDNKKHDHYGQRKIRNAIIITEQ